MMNKNTTHIIKQDLRKLMLAIKMIESCEDIQPDEYEEYVKSFNSTINELCNNWKSYKKNNNPIKLFILTNQNP